MYYAQNYQQETPAHQAWRSCMGNALIGPFGTPINLSQLEFSSTLLTNGGGLNNAGLGQAEEAIVQRALSREQTCGPEPQN